MCTKTLASLKQRILRSGSFPFNIQYGDCISSAECDALFPHIRSREHPLSPEKRWQSAVRKHAQDHGRESPSDSLRHANLMRRVSADVLQQCSRLDAVVLEVVADELGSFIYPQPLDANPTRNHHRLYEGLKSVESAILALQKVYLRPPGVLVGDLRDILVAPERLGREVLIRSVKTSWKGR